MKNTGLSQLKIEQPPATLREIVQEKMRGAIIAGIFSPGERLVERPLCDQLGVSRTVIRETIRYLEAEGLVEILPNRGPIVARLSWNDARQIYDIRRMLETAAAVACAQNATPEVHQELSGALDRLRRAFAETEDDAGLLFQESTAFYQVIFQAAGHEVAWEVVNRLNGRISRLRAMTLAAEVRRKPGIEHMQAICTSILAGDPDAARNAVEAHIADAAEVARRLLSEQEDNQ